MKINWFNIVQKKAKKTMRCSRLGSMDKRILRMHVISKNGNPAAFECTTAAQAEWATPPA
jgi:hypothetical protein